MSPCQSAFRAAVLDPARAVPEGLLDAAGRRAGKRFDVYRNNVVVSLTEALAEGFPALRRIVGAHNFGVLAGVFVRRHPPTSPVLALYGAEMPGFLEGFGPVKGLGYLPDVARLELALRRSYHAADAVPLAPEALAGAGERLAAMRLVLAPAVRLVASDWPVVSIWRFNMEDAPQPQMRPEAALVTRPGFDPVATPLDPAGAACVAALLAGRSLTEAVEAATVLEPSFDVAPVLAALVSGGAITAVEEAS